MPKVRNILPKKEHETGRAMRPFTHSMEEFFESAFPRRWMEGFFEPYAWRRPFFAEFDGYIYSYEYHSMKPETRLYEAVERAAGCGGGELLYLDDRKENVEAGLAHGWNAHLHETPEKTLEIVKAAGLLR